MPTHAATLPVAFIPSPSVNGFHLGPLFLHFYGLMYVIAITLAVMITRRRWEAKGGNPDLVMDVAIWAVPIGLVGARLYFDITTPAVMPHHWWGPFAIWDGGLGIWGGILFGALAGIWRVHRSGADWRQFADAIAPALLVAQAVGRLGNYFNQELFGKPSTLPWALEISLVHRPSGYVAFRTFQPTFLYELIFDLALAAALVWLGHHRQIRAPGLLALYVAGYSAFRIYEETLRVDYSQHILGLRLNFFVACLGTLAGLAWFAYSQRHRRGPEPAGQAAIEPAAQLALEAAPAGAAAGGGTERAEAAEPAPVAGPEAAAEH